RVIQDRDADTVRVRRSRDEPGDDGVDRGLEGGVQASPLVRRELRGHGAADPVLPRDRNDRRHDARRGRNPPAAEGAADGHPLETDLLPGVDPLGLTDRAERPPERRAALHLDLEPGRGHADQGAPPHGGLPVEVVPGENGRHRYAMPTSIPRNVESASPVASSLWEAWTTPARSSAPASRTVSQANRAFRTSTHGQ